MILIAFFIGLCIWALVSIAFKLDRIAEALENNNNEKD